MTRVEKNEPISSYLTSPTDQRLDWSVGHWVVGLSMSRSCYLGHPSPLAFFPSHVVAILESGYYCNAITEVQKTVTVKTVTLTSLDPIPAFQASGRTCKRSGHLASVKPLTYTDNVINKQQLL